MPVNFNDNDLDNIKRRIDIVELIDSYIPLKKSGVNYKACCPFHSEKTPSFVVNPEKQIYHCFGCHKGGDAFHFLKEIENLTFPESVLKLASRCGYVFPDEWDKGTKTRSVKKSDKERLYECLDKTALFYSRYLFKDKAAGVSREYLAKREINKDVASYWRLGFAPSGGIGSLIDFMKEGGFTADDLIKAGIIKKSEDNQKLTARFFNRLMFPVFDDQNRVIAFGGRVLDDSLPKYVNSPETVLYHKSKVLYGFSQGKQQIKERKSVLIVEGYFDVIRLHKAGFSNAVAPCGTALTEDQISLLSRYADQFYLAFDSDQAGINATLRKLDVILNYGIKANVVVLPEGEDPDSFIKKHGALEFESILNQSEPALDFRLKLLIKQHGLDNEYAKSKIAESMMELVSRQSNNLLSDSWIKIISAKLGFSEEALRHEFAKKRRRFVKKQDSAGSLLNENSVQVVCNPEEYVWEKEILRIIINKCDDVLLEFAKKNLKTEYFSNTIIAHLWDTIVGGESEKFSGSLNKIHEVLLSMFQENSDIYSLLTELVSNEVGCSGTMQALDEAVKRLKRKYLQDKINSCMSALPLAKGEESLLLLRRLHELQNEKAQLGFLI